MKILDIGIKRILVFIIACIGMRIIFMLTSKYIDPTYLPYLGIIALMISLSMMYIYLFGSEKAEKQLEWLGEDKTWWNQLRPVHSALYLLFAVYAFKKQSFAWIIILIDTIVGFSGWFMHHNYNITFD